MKEVRRLSKHERVMVLAFGVENDLVRFRIFGLRRNSPTRLLLRKVGKRYAVLRRVGDDINTVVTFSEPQ